jgi:hypothetical protein
LSIELTGLLPGVDPIASPLWLGWRNRCFPRKGRLLPPIQEGAQGRPDERGDFDRPDDSDWSYHGVAAEESAPVDDVDFRPDPAADPDVHFDRNVAYEDCDLDNCCASSPRNCFADVYLWPPVHFCLHL